LLVTEGALTGTRIQLGASPVTIGRAEDSTLVVADDFVSTRHARFSPRGEQWMVEDLGSTNGTYLGHRKLDGPVPMEVGVPLRIGKTVLELR
ncbi:MAG: FHA domain-containing protein FhaB/FipA, partial [Jatrophihabitantaceae bacterium]